MFCDLVGSTALSERLDPEDLQDVIGAFQTSCARVIASFDGEIANFMGDGMLVYFGYPLAHEDDPERAVRAGLGIVEAVRDPSPRSDVRLQVRVGIATGLVVVGELSGGPLAQDQAAVGETPNLAARLQAIADPDSVVVSAITRRLVGGLFDCVDFGLRSLKGFSAPVQTWRVVGESQAETRFEALHLAGLTPLVGREAELGLLLRRWQQAKAGSGRAVLLSGEPGMGKSRIVQALWEQVRRENCFRVSYHCVPYHQNTAFRPIIELFERAARFVPADSPEQKRAKLATVLSRSGTASPEAVALLAGLLSIPARDPPAAAAVEPERQRERVMSVLVDHLAGLAARRPVFVNFEDVGLMDPSTLELLGRVIEHARSARILVVIAFRPSFVPPWTNQPHLATLRLERLGRRQCLALIAAVAGARTLPPAIVDQIIARTDGVPLFLEEITRTVLESAPPGSDPPKGAPQPLTIPPTLHDWLMARLDRLGPAKALAQVCAVIGREFSYDLLVAAAGLDATELGSVLDRLVEAEFLIRRGAPPNAIYAFTQGLFREAAYASLLRSRREKLHRRLAQAIETSFPERARSEPELLAHHWNAAGAIEKAIDYWQKAAQQAIDQSAPSEAIAHLEAAMALLGPIAPTPERSRRELHLRLALGGQLIAAKGPSSPETGTAYARARDLCRELDDAEQLFPALYGLGGYHYCRAEMAESRAISEEMVRVADASGDDTSRLTAHRLLAADLFMIGAFASARAELQLALALFDPERHRGLRFTYVYDSRVVTEMYLAWTSFILGYPDQAFASCRDALAEARSLAHPHTLAYALDSACALSQLARQRRLVAQHADALISLATQHGYEYWLAQGMMYRGWTLAEGPGAAAGIAALRGGLKAHQDTGAAIFVPYHLGLLAEAQTRARKAGPALELLAEALQSVERTGERWIESELHRLTGVALLAQGPDGAGPAETSFQRALTVARGQAAALWELRTAIELARLWSDQGNRNGARTLLAPVLDRFHEGFGTDDLGAARTLVEALG